MGKSNTSDLLKFIQCFNVSDVLPVFVSLSHKEIGPSIISFVDIIIDYKSTACYG